MKARYPISRFLQIQRAYAPAWSPDGRHIVYLSDATGVPQVWRVRVDTNIIPWPEQLTYDADRVMGAWCSPAAGDGRILYAADMGGSENAQLFLQEPDGSEACLTSGFESAMHIPGAWSDDGQRILFGANRRDPGLFDLYVQRLPAGGNAELVWRNDEPGYLREMTFGPDGRHVMISRTASSFRNDLLEIDITTGSARQLNPSDEQARYSHICYMPDGNSLILITDQGSDFLHIALMNLETATVEPVVSLEWDVESLSLSPDGKLLAYVTNVDGASELRLRDLGDGSTFTAVSARGAPGVAILPGGRQAFSPDGGRLAFDFTSATSTTDVHIWELATQFVRPATRASHAGILLESLESPTLIRYPSFDGRSIPAWFYRPTNVDQKAPVIVHVHGGPEGQFRPSFNPVVQFLLQQGYAILAPNVRGSTGYGKAYSHLDDVRKRMDSVADLAYAAHWLKEQPGIDADCIAVYGGSYGGFMVLAALTAYPDLWAAGVDIVGISNLATFLENTSAYRRAHREAEYGSLQHDREFLESIAPSNHLDKLRAPLMVIHGANDPRVPLSETEQLVAALREKGNIVESLIFEDEGHGIVKLKNKSVAYPAIADFLEERMRTI